jgi:hypothetical protein
MTNIPCIYTYGPLNDPVSSSDYTVLNSRESSDNELERIQKEVVMAILFWHLPEGKKERHEKPRSGQLVSQLRSEHRK